MFLIPMAIGIATAFTAVKVIESFSKATAPPAPPPAPVLPTPEDSQATAAEDVIKKRRQSLLAGGETNITGGMGAILQPQEVQTKSLLGQ